MNSGDSSHINNGTVTGCSGKLQGSAGRSMTLQGIAELSRECSRTTATAATRVLVPTFSKEIRWGKKKHKDSGE